MRAPVIPLLVPLCVLACTRTPVPTTASPTETSAALKIEEGLVDASGALIYYKTVGQGPPLMLLHGGPGASHDYLLPYLLPLARTNRLVFIDERGSGRSERLEDVSRYTVENMADDVEAVRKALGLGTVNVLGHSYGGVLAQAYALKYQDHIAHLVLASTFHSTKQLNEVFHRMMQAMSPELRGKIEAMEKAGLYGHGEAYEKNRYTQDYMKAAWGEGYFPYLYRKHPDPNYDPTATGGMSWDLYREMWGSHGEYVVDGNLVSVEYADRLGAIKVPTLITVGDHDECDPSIARDMQSKIPGSTLLMLPESGHMTFVDQPAMYVKAVDDFVHGRKVVLPAATETSAH